MFPSSHWQDSKDKFLNLLDQQILKQNYPERFQGPTGVTTNICALATSHLLGPGEFSEIILVTVKTASNCLSFLCKPWVYCLKAEFFTEHK